jgi:hypothetical protein
MSGIVQLFPTASVNFIASRNAVTPFILARIGA